MLLNQYKQEVLLVNMKNSILKILVVIFIAIFLIVGLVPDVNVFLKNNITYEQYVTLIMIIVFITFDIFKT